MILFFRIFTLTMKDVWLQQQKAELFQAHICVSSEQTKWRVSTFPKYNREENHKQFFLYGSKDFRKHI